MEILSVFGGEKSLRSKKKKKRPVAPDGFTLLELIVVLFLGLLILGMVSLSFPRFLSSAKLQAASRELIASLKQTRALALLKGEKQVWTVDLERGEYGPEKGKKRTLSPALSLTVITAPGEEIRQGTFQVTFEPPWGWESAEFLLSDGKKYITIHLDPLTGAALARGMDR